MSRLIRDITRQHSTGVIRDIKLPAECSTQERIMRARWMGTLLSVQNRTLTKKTALAELVESTAIAATDPIESPLSGTDDLRKVLESVAMGTMTAEQALEEIRDMVTVMRSDSLSNAWGAAAVKNARDEQKKKGLLGVV
jgi:hypothetical protein